MFVSTSSSRGTADYFMQRQPEEPILWTIRFGAQRCNHVNFISVHDGSLGGDPNAPACGLLINGHIIVYVLR